MIIYTANFGLYEPVQDVRAAVEAGARCVMFHDDGLDPKELDRLGWESVPVATTMSNPEIVRNVKFCPHRFIEMEDIGVWVDGSVLVCPELVQILDGKTDLWAVRPLSVQNWYDELVRVYLTRKATLTPLLALAEWTIRRHREPQFIPMCQTRLVLRDFRRPMHVKVGEQFWDVFRMFPGMNRDQNIFAIALRDVYLRPELLDKRQWPHIFEPEGHYDRRRIKNVYDVGLPPNLDEFVWRLAVLSGHTPQEFRSLFLSEDSIQRHLRQSEKINA